EIYDAPRLDPVSEFSPRETVEPMQAFERPAAAPVYQEPAHQEPVYQEEARYHEEPEAPAIYDEPQQSHLPSYADEVAAYAQPAQHFAPEPESAPEYAPEPQVEAAPRDEWNFASEPHFVAEPEPAFEHVPVAFAPEPVEVRAEPAAPVAEFPQLPSAEEAFNLADELELNFGSQAPALQAQNAAAEAAAAAAAAAAAQVAAQAAPAPNAPHLHRSSLEVSGLRLPLANFGSRATPVAPRPQPTLQAPAEPVFEPAPQLQAQPVAELPKELFSPMEELLYDVDRYSRNEPAAAEVPVAAAPDIRAPAPVPSRAEPIRSDVFQVAPSFQETPRTQPVLQAPQQLAAAYSAPVQPAPAAPVAAAPAADFEPFADDAFELALDDIDLDMDFDLSDIGNVEPVQQAKPIEMPRVVPVAAPPVAAAPTHFAPAPVVAAPVVASIAPQRVQPAAPAPQSFSYAPQQPARVAPVAAKPAVEPEPLPFDHGQIGDTEDRPETIGEMEVPDLPVGVFEPKPAPRRHEDDLDLDTELAALFTPAATSAGLDRNRNAPNQSAARLQEAAAPFDNLDDFEKALEADFRDSMKAAQEGRAEQRHVQQNAYEQPTEQYENEERRSRRWIVPVAALGVVLVAGGVYALISGGSQTTGNGAPIIISADNDPVKEVPENPGGKTVPNQDKAVYDRVAGETAADPKQPSLISSNEEPVDVVQKTLIPESLPLEGEDDGDFSNMGTPVGETEDPRLLAQDDASARPTETEPASPAVSPRKVRTMIVKPDGTLVAQEVPETPAPAASAAQTAPEPAPLNTAGNTASGSDVPKVLETSPVAMAAPETQAPAASANNTAPVPSARPAAPAANVVSNQPVATAPAAPAAATPAPTEQAAAAPVQNTVSTGGYYVQIASLPSQAEAQKSYQSLSTKFGSVIGGRGVDIKAAEIAGKGTYYRVRIPAGDKNEAAALCERYRAAGGSCLIAR
ncbi:SPOR domain-containing protein, partial [Agrobacterium sp.]|uniref:SPOR domain-containing protein n=1 Tax=Agrobacterium sp. TaxID=361 RepID=UPI0028AF4F91